MCGASQTACTARGVDCQARRAGGAYDRDASGALNGRVTDRANAPFERVGQRPVFTPEQRAARGRDGITHISKMFARYGLTSVHHEGGDLAAIQDLRARGDLRHRVNYEAIGPVLEAMILSGVQTGFGDEWLRMGKLADFVVLGGDPFTVDAGKIKDIGVVRTVTGGRVMYQG